MNKKITKLLIIIGSLLLLLGLGAIVLYADQQLAQSQQAPPKVTLIGSISCVPHKQTDGPQTLECAVGLKTDDGKYYLLTSNPHTEMNGRVKVSGYITKTLTKYQAIYDAEGVINNPTISRTK